MAAKINAVRAYFICPHLITRAKSYQALTTAEGIRNWWTRDAVLDSKIGGTGEFRFYEGKGVTNVRVDELKPPVRVGWKTIFANAPGGWDGTTITFDLRAEGATRCSPSRTAVSSKRTKAAALVNTGWAYYLVSLQQYLETGKGAPQQDKASRPHPLANADRAGAGSTYHKFSSCLSRSSEAPFRRLAPPM